MNNKRHTLARLAGKIFDLAREVCGLREETKTGFDWLKSADGPATKHDLKTAEKKIMSKIKETTDAIQESLDKSNAAIEVVNKSVTGLTEDVAFLKKTIDQLQNNPGSTTPEDQKLLDAAQTRTIELQNKVTGISTALEALDAGTTPTPNP